MQDTPTLFWKLSDWLSGVPTSLTILLALLAAVALVILIRMGADGENDHSPF